VRQVRPALNVGRAVSPLQSHKPSHTQSPALVKHCADAGCWGGGPISHFDAKPASRLRPAAEVKGERLRCLVDVQSGSASATRIPPERCRNSKVPQQVQGARNGLNRSRRRSLSNQLIFYWQERTELLMLKRCSESPQLAKFRPLHSLREIGMSVEKVAVITAGGSGMGADAARRLASDGFKVAILSSSGKG
jgi:hypothetical protein